MKINQLHEIDNGPGKVKNIPQVTYGVAKDAAKLDFSHIKGNPKAPQPKKVKIKEIVAKAQKQPKPEINWGSVMMAIDAAIGSAFPDGDPIDYLSKYKIGDLDKAIRQNKAGKNYNDYVKSVWQQHIDDNPDLGVENPW